jgi:hypothetical protein
MPSIAALRHAPWSLSKVKCAVRCPQEFHFKYVAKIAEPFVAADARIGKGVHAALEVVLCGGSSAEAITTGRKELLHEEEHKRFDELMPAVESFLRRVAGFRERRRVTFEMIEHRLAVNSTFEPTLFLAKDAFFRGVWDAGFLFDDGVLAVVDHKTGVRQVATRYADQLEGYATLAAANMAYVKKVWLGVHFVPDAAMEWSDPVPLALVREEFAPRVLAYIEEAAKAVAGPGAPEPRMSAWCKRCSYRSICPAMRSRSVDELEGDPDALGDVGNPEQSAEVEAGDAAAPATTG